MTKQERHDLLLEVRPDDAKHDETACMFCTAKASEEENVADDLAIFTQEQHDVLLATAVEKASAEARADADTEVLSLNEKLEAATKAAEESAATIATLETAIADRDESERLAVLAGERVALVGAVAEFSDEQIEKRKESWANMEEEDFDAYLEDIKAVASVKTDDDDGDEPDTKFDGTRKTAGADDDGGESNVVAFFGSNLDVAAQS